MNTLCERNNYFFANLTEDFIPLSQEEVSNYSGGDFDVANNFLISASEACKSLRSLNRVEKPQDLMVFRI